MKKRAPFYVLAAFSAKLTTVFKEKILPGFIEFVRTILSGLWLDRYAL